MKRLFAYILTILIMLTLGGCAEKEEVKFYETKTYVKQSTGDINLLEKTYDENWNLLLSYITLNGNFASKVEYEYSEDFTVLTTKSTSAIYEPDTSKVIRTFDEKGQVIKAETYDGEQLMSTTEYTYDEKDRCIREARYAGDGTLELYHEYVYDEKTRTKTRTCYYADGTADNHSDVYTYDEYGNEVLLEKLRDGEVYWRIQYNYVLLETAEERS